MIEVHMLEAVEKFSCGIAGRPAALAIVRGLKDLRLNCDPTLHPYGFYIWKIDIVGLVGFKLRLHVWLSGIRQRQKPDWPPHSHNSSLYSLVLSGGVTNLVWKWRSDVEGPNIIYNVGYCENLSKLTRSNCRGYLDFHSIHQVKMLQQYSVREGVFHSTEVPLDESAVTLVLISSSTHGESKVVGELGCAGRYIFDRQTVAVAHKRAAQNLAAHTLRALRT